MVDAERGEKPDMRKQKQGIETRALKVAQNHAWQQELMKIIADPRTYPAVREIAQMQLATSLNATGTQEETA